MFGIATTRHRMGNVVAASMAALAMTALAPQVAHGQTIGELNDSISKLEKEMGKKEAAASEAQETLSSIIRDAYKSDGLIPGSGMELVLGSDNLDEFIENSQFVSSLNQKYEGQIDEARQALAELTEVRDDLVELKETKAVQMLSRQQADSMHFCQWGESYSDVPYYGGTIANAGCGLCAYTSAINILKGTNYTPDTMLEVCGDWEGLIHYPEMTVGTPDGTTHAEWTKKQFDVDMRVIDNSVDAIRSALSDDESVIIVLARGNSFKSKSGAWRYTNGHYVCIYRCDDKGFYAHDSALQGDEGTAVYYADNEMGTMLDTGTFVELSN